MEIDTAIVDLATKLQMPPGTLREQFQAMRAPRGRRPAPRAPDPSPNREASVTTVEKAPIAPMEPSNRRAYECLIAAALLDTSLIPRLRPWIARLNLRLAPAQQPSGPSQGSNAGSTAGSMDGSGVGNSNTAGPLGPERALNHIFQTLIDLYDHESADITPALLINHLAGHPAGNDVARIMDLGWTADNPQHLFEGAVDFLRQREHQVEIHRLQVDIQQLEALSASDPQAAMALENALMRLIELRRDSPS